jgi:hypothetical protein
MISLWTSVPAFSYCQQTDENAVKPPPLKPLKLTFKTDLRVEAIHTSHCVPEKDTEDAFYMSNIMVDVANYKTGKVGAACESILTVTYFDMKQNKKITLKRQLPKISVHPKKTWQIKQFVVVMVPVSVKKDIGITATIKPKRDTVSDPIKENNSITVKQCNVMVY